jgi:DNA-binding MarR family transcriptional regulator
MKKADQEQLEVGQLQALLGLLKHTLGDLYRKETAILHCSMSHIEIMQYMSEHANPTMKDVAGYLRITPPSVTTLIDTMVEHKLVKRETLPGDRRSVRVVLTPKARKLSVTLHHKKTKLLTKILKKLSIEQKKQLSEIISTLIK